MLLKNEFELDADLDLAWALLTDLERIAPCMPGARLDGRDGDAYLGSVRVKVGPIGAHFTGTARFDHRDDAARVAVIAASGKDPRGQATAAARIHARLEPVGPARTRVLIDTDLDISGRMAQFGRGAIADVSNRLIGQFVSNLSTQLVPADTPREAAAPPPPPQEPEAGGLNAAELILPVLRDRYGKAAAGVLLGFLLGWLVFGRRR
ncbi:SRPBCC family protein [Acrocarpospora catenulata]|uniref:SRPBCC family protein n=1 Tax=Acrocarpospora catenulata TaxID=2836182 RepID=UPI001BDA2D13|nr:SRPBCC family protein [Acrocarpospora catenulata]